VVNVVTGTFIGSLATDGFALLKENEDLTIAAITRALEEALGTKVKVIDGTINEADGTLKASYYVPDRFWEDGNPNEVPVSPAALEAAKEKMKQLQEETGDVGVTLSQQLNAELAAEFPGTSISFSGISGTAPKKTTKPASDMSGGKVVSELPTPPPTPYPTGQPSTSPTLVAVQVLSTTVTFELGAAGAASLDSNPDGRLDAIKKAFTDYFGDAVDITAVTREDGTPPRLVVEFTLRDQGNGLVDAANQVATLISDPDARVTLAGNVHTEIQARFPQAEVDTTAPASPTTPVRDVVYEKGTHSPTQAPSGAPTNFPTSSPTSFPTSVAVKAVSGTFTGALASDDLATIKDNEDRVVAASWECMLFSVWLYA